jgi:nondiscriminating glutamyl-tRNA synthetase
MSVRVRFAPSPTGRLHVGNVRTALFNWLLARQQGGTFILRIEDTDAERSEARFEDRILGDLEWLGLRWNEGVRVGGGRGPYRQTERLELYREHGHRLLERGKAYFCFCSPERLESDRRSQQEAGRSLRYEGRCRDLDPEASARRVAGGEPATVRLRVREGRVVFDDLVFGRIAIETSTIGDFILLRSDGSAQYNFACVVDDALMEISHVIRGEGHLSNTPRQVLVYESLGLTMPRFAHLSTILGPDGAKLSKRHGATSISEFRSLGYLPEALLNYLSLLGWSPPESRGEILELDQIIADFDLGRVQVSPATFDPDKLNWVNRGHLKELSADDLVARATPFLVRDGLIPADPAPEVAAWTGELISLLLNYCDRLGDLPAKAREILALDPGGAPSEAIEVLGEPGAVDVIRHLRDVLDARGEAPLGSQEYREAALEVQRLSGCKGRQLFRPIRVAVTGRTSGPELDRLVEIVERGSRLSLPVSIRGVRRRVRDVWEQLSGGEKD